MASVLQKKVLENLFGMHVLTGTWDTKTLIGEFTVLREDSSIRSEYLCGECDNTGKCSVLPEGGREARGVEES